MRTNVYVDGFNLYYGCLKGTPYRWLNIETLCRLLLPRNQVQRIYYCTARISARPHDPAQPVRQETYLRALATLPSVSIIFGRFLSHPVQMHLVNPPPGRPATVTVLKTEEKGSDVNLATYLLLDACHNAYDVAVMVTNDSDLAEPLRVVKQEFGKTVGILNPYQRANVQLQQHADFRKSIRAGVLAASQFPPTLTDSTGVFHKPTGW